MLVAQAALDHHEYDPIGLMNNDFEMRLCLLWKCYEWGRRTTKNLLAFTNPLSNSRLY